MPRLVMISPEFAEQFCELPDGVFTLGRSRDNHLVVPDPSVSARHCELLVCGREVIVRENGSRNGTYIQGVRVAAQSGVNHWQVVRFGRVEARMEIEPPPDDDASSITAMDHYRAIMRSSSETAARPASFPVYFIAAQAIQLEPVTERVAVLPQAPECWDTCVGHSSPEARTHNWRAACWIAGLAAGSTGLALLVFWLWL